MCHIFLASPVFTDAFLMAGAIFGALFVLQVSKGLSGRVICFLVSVLWRALQSHLLVTLVCVGAIVFCVSRFVRVV